MSNVTTTWSVKLQDRVTGPMQKVVTTATTATKAVENVGTAVNYRLSQTGRISSSVASSLNTNMQSAVKSIESLTAKVGQLNDSLGKVGKHDIGGQLKDQFSSAEKQIGSGGLMKSIIGGNLISGLVTKGAGAVVGAVGSSIGSGMEAGRTKTGFQVMAGDKEGGQLFDDVTKFAQDSIFGNELYENATVLKSFGEATKEVMPDLKMLGDISMGNTEKMKSLTLAYAQIGSAGRLMGQDLLQLINAGFNPLQVMSQKTGKSMAELKEMMEQGKISANDVKLAFQAATSEGGNFYNMTNKIAQTPFGKWEALKGQIEGVGMQLGTALMPVVGSVLGVLGSIADKLPSVITAFQPLFDAIAALPIGDMMGQLAGLAVPILTTLMPALVSIVNMGGQIAAALMPVFQALAPIVMVVVQVVSDLVAIIAPLIGQIVEALAPGLTVVAKVLGMVLTPILKVAGAIIGVVVTIVGKLVEGLAWLNSALLDNLLKPFKAIYKFFAGNDEETPKTDPKTDGPKTDPETTPKGITGTDFKFSGGKPGKGSGAGGGKSGDGLSISGNAQGRIITMTLNIKNYFSDIKGDLDVRRIADQVFSQVNDRLRDSVLSL